MQQKFRIPSHSEISEETPCSSHLAFFSMNLSRHAWDHCQFGGNSVVWTKTHFPELAFKFFTFLFAKSHAVKTTRHAAITIYSFPFSFPKYRTFSTQNEIPKHQYTRMARIPFIFLFFSPFLPKESCVVQTSEGRTAACVWETTTWAICSLRSENKYFLNFNQCFL